MSKLQFVLGFGIGFALALAFTPASGEQSRRLIANKARELIQFPSRKIEEETRKAAELAKEKAGQIGSDVGRQAAEAAVDAVEKNLFGTGNRS